MCDTVLAYVECDFNAKQAAERLFVHANTFHYRLARIEERTGLSARRFHDLLLLVLAIRLCTCLNCHRRIFGLQPDDTSARRSVRCAADIRRCTDEERSMTTVPASTDQTAGCGNGHRHHALRGLSGHRGAPRRRACAADARRRGDHLAAVRRAGARPRRRPRRARHRARRHRRDHAHQPSRRARRRRRGAPSRCDAVLGLQHVLAGADRVRVRPRRRASRRHRARVRRPGAGGPREPAGAPLRLHRRRRRARYRRPRGAQRLRRSRVRLRVRLARRRAAGHRDAHLHVRHDRAAQGRRAHAREPRVGRGRVARCHRPVPRRPPDVVPADGAPRRPRVRALPRDAERRDHHLRRRPEGRRARHRRGPPDAVARRPARVGEAQGRAGGEVRRSPGARAARGDRSRGRGRRPARAARGGRGAGARGAARGDRPRRCRGLRGRARAARLRPGGVPAQRRGAHADGRAGVLRRDRPADQRGLRADGVLGRRDHQPRGRGGASGPSAGRCPASRSCSSPTASC